MPEFPLRRAFGGLGRLIGRFRFAVVGAWVLVLVLAWTLAGRLPTPQSDISTPLAGAECAHVEEVLHGEFTRMGPHALWLTFSSPRLTLDDRGYQSVMASVTRRLKSLAEVRDVVNPLGLKDKHLYSPDGHLAAVLVRLNAPTLAEAERAVPVLREAIHPDGTALLAVDPMADFALTGQAAIAYDRDAGGPLRLLQENLPLSLALLAGMTLGTCYLVLLFGRWRACLRDLPSTLEMAGPEVIFSSLPLLAGCLALAYTPLPLARSLGVYAALAIVVVGLAALTLLPAVLGILGQLLPPLPAGRTPAAPLNTSRVTAIWPLVLVSLVLGLGLASPLADSPWPPANGEGPVRSTESRFGLSVLRKMGHAGALTPINVVAWSRDHAAMPANADQPGLHRLAARIAGLPHVAEVFAPTGPEQFSKDRTAALFQVTLDENASRADARHLAAMLEQLPEDADLRFEVGGQAAEDNEVARRLRRGLPWAIALMIVTMFGVGRLVTPIAPLGPSDR